MKRWRKMLLISGIVLISLTTLFLAACSNTQGRHQSHESTGHGMMGKEGMDHGMMGKEGMGHDMDHAMDLGPADDTFDLRFIDGMIVHHQGAVEMAEEALLKSQRPEILALAEEIIAAQAVEIDLMNRWKRAWYPHAGAQPVMYDHATGTVVPMSTAQIAAMKMSGDLGAADAQFDLRFIEAMVPHHQGAVDMALDALDKSQRTEIRSLSEEIISAQKTEIELMLSWQERWYGTQDHEKHH